MIPALHHYDRFTRAIAPGPGPVTKALLASLRCCFTFPVPRRVFPGASPSNEPLVTGPRMGDAVGARLSTPSYHRHLRYLAGASFTPRFTACAPGDGQSKPAMGSGNRAHPNSMGRRYGYQRPSGWADRRRERRGLAGLARLVRVASRGLAWACVADSYFARLRVGQTLGP